MTHCPFRPDFTLIKRKIFDYFSLKKRIISVVLEISFSSFGLVKASARFIIKCSEKKKKLHAFKSVHFEWKNLVTLEQF